MTPTVEPASPAHAAVLAGLHAATFERPWDAGSLGRLLALPGSLALLARQADQPQGFILLQLAGEEAEVLTVCVLPEHRRRGIAGQLLDAALARLGELGIRRIVLEVATDNAAARALYRRGGFVEVGRRPGYYARTGEPPADALILARELCR